jgi:hypothetical protein
MLRIWNFIPDPNFFPSRIRIKEIFSQKYDPGRSSWIPDPDPDFLPIPGLQGSKKHRIPDPQHCMQT